MADTGWTLLERGKYKDAIAVFARRLRSKKDPIAAYNMALAHLCLNEATAAIEVLDGLLHWRFAGTAHYAAAGVARWVMGRRIEAVALWKKGLACQYADAAGGMELPLLLYFAAARDAEALNLAEAKRIVRDATRHRWADSWPGPLGLFVLGKISESDVRQLACVNNPDVMRRRNAQIDFYIGVTLLESGDLAGFRRQMKHCASIPKWYLENEYYLARVEA